MMGRGVGKDRNGIQWGYIEEQGTYDGEKGWDKVGLYIQRTGELMVRRGVGKDGDEIKWGCIPCRTSFKWEWDKFKIAGR